MTYLTEAEAQQQRCPFFRSVIVRGYDAVQGQIREMMHEPCQGSACKIGWRWADKERERHAPPPAGPTDTVESIESAWDNYGKVPRRGYCGGMGKPE